MSVFTTFYHVSCTIQAIEHVQVTFNEHSGHIQGTFGNIQGTFGHIQGTFRACSGNLVLTVAERQAMSQRMAGLRVMKSMVGSSSILSVNIVKENTELMAVTWNAI
jgi:hypothetical protein